MLPGLRLRARGALLALGLLVGLPLIASCSTPSSAPEPDASGRVSVYVTSKVVPEGMLVATARNNGSFELRSLPADVAGQDGVTNFDGLDCLVAAQALPAGTVVRRNQLVPPESIGLSRGLTGDTGPRPAGC